MGESILGVAMGTGVGRFDLGAEPQQQTFTFVSNITCVM